MTLSGRGYRCSEGETWDEVALKVYGNEKYAAELLNANPALCLTPVFVGGETILLPVVEVPRGTDGEEIAQRAPWKE